jgi:hypothetical protein
MNYDKQRYLEQLQKEFLQHRQLLSELMDRILSEGITRYPILVAHRQPIDLGRPVILAEVHNSFWSVSVSPLEEMVSKGLVTREQVRQFKLRYDTPREKPCVLMIPPESPEEANFIFLPFGSNTTSEISPINLN